MGVQNAAFGAGNTATIQLTEMYSYTLAAQMNGKRLQINETPIGYTNLTQKTGRDILHNPASELLLPRLENRLPEYILNAEEAERVIA